MLKRLAAIIILWTPFSLACLIAVPISFIGILVWSQGYAKNLLGGMDRVLSGLFGFNSKYTLSAHCGTGKLPLLKVILDTIQKDHCEGAAKNEGLL